MGNRFKQSENKLKKDKTLPKSTTKRITRRDQSQMVIDFEKSIADHIKQRKVNKKVSMAIGWVGGKWNIADKLISMMPKHEVYCEVFFGGGSLFFRKPKVYINFVNDLNSNLTNMYTVMRDNPDDFWKYASYFMYARDIFDYCLEKYKSEDWKNLEPTRKAVIFYYMIRASFNKNMNNFSKDQKYSIWDEYQNVIKIGEKLQSVCIENRDYRQFVKDRLNEHKDKKTMFYLDPPYVVAEKTSYYEFLFSDMEHRDLCRLCDDIDRSGNYFMLSYENIGLIQDLYRQYHQTELEWTYTMGVKKDGTKKIGKEIVVTNFKPQGEQLKIL